MRGRKNYTRTDMDAWAVSLIELPKEIKTLENTVVVDKNQLALLQEQLQALKDNQISPTQLLITKLIAKIELPTLQPQIQTLAREARELTEQADSLSDPISKKRAEIKPINAEIERIKRLIALKDIHRVIAQLDEDISQLSQSSRREESDLVVARNTLSSIQATLDSKQLQLTSLQQNKTTLLTAIESLRYPVYDASPVMVQSGGVSVVTSAPVTTVNPVTVQSSRVSVVTASPAYQSSDLQLAMSLLPDVTPHHHHHHNHNREHIAELERQLRDVDSLIDNCNRDIRRQKSERDDAQYKIRQIEDRIDRARQNIRDKHTQKRRLETDQNNYSSIEQQQAHSSTTEVLNRELREQRSVLSPLEYKFDQLASNQSALNNGSSSRRAQIRQLEKREQECIRLTTDFEVSLDVPLEKQRDAQQVLLRELEVDKLRREKEIQALRVKISTDENTIKDKNRELAINQANQFLKSLKNNPQALLDTLEIAIYQAIRKFESEHPEEQSFSVRKCLTELQYKIPFLKNAPLSANDEITLARGRYFLFCGLTYDMFCTTRYSDDKGFSNKISQVLQSHDIDLDGARSEYQTLKLQHPRELLDLTVADLARMEREAYANARDNFNTLLARISTPTIPELKYVKKLGEQLAENIHLKEKAAETTHLDFDYKYYNGLFNLASQLLAQPRDINLHIAFRHHIGHHPNETPSCGYKVGGIAMMFLGAVTTAAAAIVALFGFPIGTPLYVSLPVAGVGLGMIAGGIVLFRHGNNKGLPGTLNEFVDEVDKHKGQQLLDNSLEAETPLKGKGPGSYNIEPSAPLLGI